MFSNCLSVHGVPIEAERSQSSSKTLKDSLICILDDVLIQILLNIKETCLMHSHYPLLIPYFSYFFLCKVPDKRNNSTCPLYIIEHFKFVRETGSVLCRSALWDRFGDVIASFIGCYEIARETGSKLIP